MRTCTARGASRGFALIITLSLLALLVLAVLALATLARVNSRMAAAAAAQTQARQNALLGLGIGLGELQRHAGEDNRLTGMAGITGIAAGQNAVTRYWCGVWRNDGALVAWLTSGATSATNAGPNPVELISANTVGAAASTSANAEKEHVIAGRVPIVVTGTATSPTAAVTTGHYAYLVTDEGIKIGTYAPAAQRASPGIVPRQSPQMLLNQAKLRTALDANAVMLPGLVSYEQLGLLASVTPSVLQDCFHYMTITPRTVADGRTYTGMINVNTASTLTWRCLLDTYNAAPGVLPIGNVTAQGNFLGNNFAATTVGKAANAPFPSIAAFASYLATAFPPTGSPNATEIMAVLGPLLTVRSDTFRIRGYGEVLNPADSAQVDAVAYCEAIVQRTPEPAPSGMGRRFAVIYFRWLGPDDI
jgi:hypothetical protein